MSYYHQKMKNMKNVVKIICTVIILLSVAGCNPYDTWPIGLPELEHTYYVSSVKTGNGTEQDLQYEILSDGTSRFMNRIHYNPAPPAGTPLFEWLEDKANLNVTFPVRMRFISEYIRTYDVTTYFWVEVRSGGLIAGTDFQVLTESGATMAPNAQGAYSLTWAKAEKAQQSIKIKRISDQTGELRVMYLDRSKFSGTGTWPNPDRNLLDELLNNQTSDYIVRGFWHDYNFPVIIRFL